MNEPAWVSKRSALSGVRAATATAWDRRGSGAGVSLGQTTVHRRGRLRRAVNLSAVAFHCADDEIPEAHVRQ